MKLFLLVLASALLCAPYTTVAEAPAAKELVKIGVILPLTGNVATYGKDAAQIVELLTPKLNASNRKYRYQFLLDDGKCGIGNAASTIAQKLINVDRVSALIVGCSGEGVQVAPIAERYKVPLVAYGAAHPDMREAGDYVFRTYIDLSKGVDLAAADMSRTGRSRIAILTEETSFTAAIRVLLRERLGEHIVFDEDFGMDDNTHQTLLTKARTKSPDAYYFNVATPQSYVTMLKKFRLLNLKGEIHAYHQPGNKVALEALGTLQEGVKFFDVPEIVNSSPEYKALYHELVTTYPEAPALEFLARTAYDAVMSLVDSIEKVGTGRDAIKDQLYRHDTLGALGRVTFDSKGDIVDLNFVYKVIEHGVARSVR